MKFNRYKNISGRKIKKKTLDILHSCAYKKDYTKYYDNGTKTEFGLCWFVKDRSNKEIYIGHVGMESDLAILGIYDIDTEVKHGTGFSSKSQKWYGWSHRAINSFGVGSTIKRGDCAYQPNNKIDFENAQKDFWTDNSDNSKYGYNQISVKLNTNVLGSYYEEDEETLGCEVVKETEFFGTQEGRENRISKHWIEYPKEYGRGEWTAETLEDAKIMAQDFSKGVS